MPKNGLKPRIKNWERGLYHVLSQQNEIGFGVADRVRTGQLFVFRIVLAQPSDLSKVLKLSEELGLVLGVESPRLARHLSYVDLEIPLPAQHHRALPVGALNRKNGLWVTLGQTASGTPVSVNLGGTRTCHALVSGMTGSGKTVAQHLVAWSLAMGNEPQNLSLILVDGKGGVSWWGFDREAHLAHPIIDDPSEAVAALTWCVSELDRRKSNGDRRKLFIVIDEARELLQVGGEPVAQSIQRIAALGRELGVHIVIATQHALVDALGGSIAKANLPLRLTGRVADSNAAFVATGVRDSRAEALRGNGDFLVTVAGASHRVQIALVGNREFGQLPRVEETPRLDFGELDPARVLDVCEAPRNAPDDLEPEHVAVALALDVGINRLQSELGIGGAKATRVRKFAQSVREKLDELGYSVILAFPEVAQ